MATSASVDEAALALLYRLLAVGFTAPDESAVDELRTLAGALAIGGALGDPGLNELLADLEAALDDEPVVGQLAAAHHDLFGGAVRCAPYETSYERDPFRSGRRLADVAGVYRAFGARPGGPAAERADHVGCELEFLSYLVARRLDAERAGDADQAAVCREAEDGFLLDHLGRWLPVFAQEVRALTPSPVYALLALLAERAIVTDVQRRGLAPRPVARAAPTVVEHDTLECGGELFRPTAPERASRPPRPPEAYDRP